MPNTTPRLGLPYPTPDETVDVPRDVKALAEAMDPLGGVPVGTILMWPSTTLPPGFLLCNGASVPSGNYPLLAAVIAPVGGNIILPNLVGRAPVGAGALPGSSPAASSTLGQPGGAASVALSAAQSGLQDHAHDMTSVSFGGSGPATVSSAGKLHISGYTVAGAGTRGLGPPGTGTYNYGIGVGGVDNGARNGAAHDNMPPFFGVNFIIRAT